MQPIIPPGENPMQPLTPSKQPMKPLSEPIPKNLEPWAKMMGPNATAAEAKMFRDQTIKISTDFIKTRLAKMRENAKRNQRLGLYGEY